MFLPLDSSTIRNLSLAIIIFFSGGCEKAEPPAQIPDLLISSLSDGDAFERGSLVTIIFDIQGTTGNLQSKLFLDDQTVLFDGNLPFIYEWDTRESSPGNHTISLQVYRDAKPIFKGDTEVRIYEVNNQPCPGTPTLTDIDGNTYRTILIGNQCWMKENLKVTRYADGTPLVDGTGAGNTQYDTVTKYYFNYNDDESYVDTYGRLYIWMAAVNGDVSEADPNPSKIQGVCPDGWHLPSDAEWRELELFLGMALAETTDRDWRGTIEGDKLKEAGNAHWKSLNEKATNESGFTALPGGHRNLSGAFKSIDEKASFWTSTNHIAYNKTQNPAFRMLSNSKSNIYRYRGFHGYLTYARSVRCVKD